MTQQQEFQQAKNKLQNLIYRRNRAAGAEFDLEAAEIDQNKADLAFASTIILDALKHAMYNDFYPEHYGAAGDGVTDDGPAFKAMYDAMPVTGGRVVLKSKIYQIESNFLVITKCLTMVGQGGTDYFNTPSHYKTVIRTSHPTANVFTMDVDNVVFKGIGFINANTNPTAGSALWFRGNGDNLGIHHCTFRNFYDNVNVANGGQWGISWCFFMSWRHVGLIVEYGDLADGGDMMVSNCWFYGGEKVPNGSGGFTSSYHGEAGLLQKSGGGLKVENCKFVGYVEAGMSNWAFKADITGSTGDLLFSNNSFEGYRKGGIYIDKSVEVFSRIVITGNQIAGMPEVADVYIKNVYGVVITGNSFWHYPQIGTPAILLENIHDVNTGVNNCFDIQVPLVVINADKVHVVRDTWPLITTTGSWQMGLSKNAILPLNSNKSVNPLNLVNGDEGTILATQDSNGGRSITWPEGSLVSGTLAENPNDVNLIKFNYLNGRLFFDIKGYAAPASSYLLEARFNGSNGTGINSYSPEQGSFTSTSGAIVLDGNGNATFPVGSFVTKDFAFGNTSKAMVAINDIGDANAVKITLLGSGPVIAAQFNGSVGPLYLLVDGAVVDNTVNVNSDVQTFSFMKNPENANQLWVVLEGVEIMELDITGRTFTGIRVDSVGGNGVNSINSITIQ